MTTLKSLNDIDANVLVLFDRWKNVSRVRNELAKMCPTEKMVMMDDDLQFSKEDFCHLVSDMAPKKVIWSTACWAIHKTDYWKVGGFDERYFRVYEEDTDFMIRLTKQFKVEFRYQLVTHLGGKRTWRKRFLIKFNRAMTLLKHNRAAIIKEIFSWQGKHPLRWFAHASFLIGLVYYFLKLKFSSGGTSEAA